MKTVRKFSTIAVIGLAIGCAFSTTAVSTAGARAYSTCDNKIDKMETAAARDLAKGKLDEAEYLKVMAEVDFHRQLWGC
ncbi:MAG: hypothetical protein JWM86_346 [Thermoleophilia bacterium]|nr:hypothetical protein [Thermoleophilia bacterium]